MNPYWVSLVLDAHENVLPGEPPEKRLTAIVGVYGGDLDSLWVVVNERSRQRAGKLTGNGTRITLGVALIQPGQACILLFDV